MTWCRNTRDSENRLMLLTAVAGAGKTSIALTIAERCASDEDVTLLLQYFFKEGERSRPDIVFSGIARALADHDPVYRTFITSALRKDPSLSTTSFATQFKKLVAPALLHKPPPSDHPMVIILDALDECDKEVFESLAEILGEEVPKLPSSVKFFLTSRQFDLVNRYLSPDYPIYRLTINLSDETNVQDYLRSNLRDEDKTVQEILGRANGLFIWISTIFRYMKMANKDPMRTLESLLDTGAKQPDVPAEKMMDNLYTSILKKCAWEDEDFADDYPIVMGAILVAQQPLSITAWDAILSPSLKSSVRYTLAELAPLLSGVEDSHIPVRILHQSLRDFVELCSIKGLGLIENLSERDEMPCIPPKELSEHFQYACRYIVHHLSGVQEPSQELSESVATRWVEVCVRMESYISISLLPEWTKLAVDHRSKGSVSALANALTKLPWNLIFHSRFQEAYEAANDSVVLCRYLFSVDSGSHSTVYIALSKLGRHSEALPFIEESLVAVNPGSYTPDLASHSTSIFALSNLGRHSEALPFIEESVKLRRQLVAVNPGSYTPNLAMSLNNLYLALSNLGRHSEALPFIEESVKLRRQLVADHTPHLAMSLNNLYLALSNLGRHSEALPFIEESVKLYRQLVAVNPGSYTPIWPKAIIHPDLAMSLNNLYLALSNLGRHSEALPFIEESVKLYRQLVAALPFIEESVKLYRQLVAVNPGSYTPDLAIHSTIYIWLFPTRTALGGAPIHRRRSNSPTASFVNPGVITPKLAKSLKNLRNALSNLGRHSEAQMVHI
ncbi:uncharacterized protein EI90DRAFT_3059439 [Cantharellus anzutake]|uniref:uncharacterized protein n=1 Tax=Cantharellus anzutake TaxID=1750568 RepID=UPI001903AD55|nr:uncharacterized protein EI90DRAFT_3059439 [Cantharellus anzutake]KAF8330832.1 hypothetical protein EI90DRAFT_3059439 [Cantharellus anzutake]